MSMITATELTKEYGEETAVDGLEFEVERGSIHGFVGPNGAGKTTTMKMLVGLTSPTAGEARIDGEPAGSMAAKRAIGYAPQDPSLYESMSARRYLVYMGKAAGMGSDVHDRADELLEWLDLADAADRQIAGFSGGMERRLSLAQAMIHEPELLILDEPTAELDPSGRRAIIESLEELTDDGMTVFVSSHVLAELEQFIDTVTILVDGQLVETGPIGEVQDEYGGQSFRIESSDDDALLDLLSDREWTGSVEREGDAVLARSDSPEEFQTELQALMAEEGILLQSMQEAGGLQEAFADIVDGDGDGGGAADGDADSAADGATADEEAGESDAEADAEEVSDR